MSEESETGESVDTEEAVEEDATETTEEETEAVTDDVLVDLDSAEEYETDVEQLQETVEDQAERIEELEGLLLDLSVRVADDRGMGVCPDCHGPVEKVSRWLRPTKIECRSCGRVFHES